MTGVAVQAQWDSLTLPRRSAMVAMESVSCGRIAPGRDAWQEQRRRYYREHTEEMQDGC